MTIFTEALLLERRPLGRSNQEGASTMTDAIEVARESMTVKRVFGEPIRDGDAIVLPAARIRGGAGGGAGQAGPEKEGGERSTGSGSGFGFTAVPAGAFVVRGGKVRWRPAVDVNRIVLGAQVVAIVGLLTVRAIVRAGARRRLEQRRNWAALGLLRRPWRFRLSRAMRLT